MNRETELPPTKIFSLRDGNSLDVCDLLGVLCFEYIERTMDN